MLGYLFIFILVPYSFAKLSLLEDIDRIDAHFSEKATDVVKDFDNGDPLWILSLKDNEWMAPKLRLGTREELDDYYYYIHPKFMGLRKRQAARVKKDDPEKPKKLTSNNNATMVDESNNDVKRDILKMINKFVLTTNVEPDTYLESYDNTPSIELNFKRPNTACIVRSGKNEWHYIMSSNSKIPSWFYEKHDTKESPIIIPEKIKNKFFNALLHYLRLLFGHPV